MKPFLSPSEQLAAEHWLASRLKAHGIFDGITTTENRKEQFRAACLKFACVIAGQRAGKPESYAQCFERIFGEPLTPPRAKPAADANLTTQGT